MKNEVKRATEEECRAVLKRTDPAECFTVAIDGAFIRTESDLFDTMEKEYGFHVSKGSWGKNWPAFKDMMTDLGWIDCDKHILVIYHFGQMLADCPEEKDRLVHYLSDLILPFWEEDVLRCVVEGKRKEFTVYFAD